MKASLWRRTWAGKYLRHIPRIKQLRGTFVHRTFGDRLLDPALWHWERHSTALGLAIGAFFCMLPIPGQSIPAAALAVLLRGNVPAALVGCWISNPVTFAPFFYLQLKIGAFLLGQPSLIQQFSEHSFLHMLKVAPAVLFVGGAVLGLGLAGIAYVASLLIHDVAVKAIHRSSARRARVQAAAGTSAKAQPPEPANHQ